MLHKHNMVSNKGNKIFRKGDVKKGNGKKGLKKSGEEERARQRGKGRGEFCFSLASFRAATYG